MSEAIQDSAPATDTPIPKKVERNRVLSPERFKWSEYEILQAVIIPPEGDTKEDILKPSYWAHMANLLKPWAEIRVLPDMMNFWGKLVVKEVHRAAVVVFVDRWEELDVVDSAELSKPDHRVVWRGQMHKFSIVRISDQKVIKEGIQTKEIAARELLEYVAKIS